MRESIEHTASTIGRKVAQYYKFLLIKIHIPQKDQCTLIEQSVTLIKLFQLLSKFNSRSHQEQLQFANHLFDELPPSMHSSVKLAQKKGASNWLSCLPLKSHNFVVHKTAFRDAIVLRYHWLPSACPTSCACGHSFTIEHALSCPKGGFPSLRHN